MHSLHRFIAGGMILLAMQVSFAQIQDNPLLDTPVPLAPRTPTTPAGITVITTPDGFDNFNLGTTNAEPHMVSNPLNPLWFFNAFNTNTTFHSEDGYSWTTNNPSFPSAAGDPVAAYDSLGNLYYETMKSPITGTWVVKSTNNGQTWSTAASAATGNDKNWIAADQTMGPFANYVYTSMTNSGVGNFARTTDGGATWNTTFAPTTQSLPGMMVAVGPDVSGGNNISGGCVYVVTHSGTNAAGIYTFYVSTDGGATFTQKSTNQFSNLIGIQISGRSTVQGMRCRPYPMIAADNSFGPYRGRLYLVYASNNPAGDSSKSDIFLRYSTDQGVTWSDAAIVNDDPNSQNNYQFHPAIWCDKETGRLYIKFYDTRRVATSDSMDVYATYTDDGGQTFAPNQRLTNRTFKINISGAVGPTYRGDYDAITSNRYASMAIWTDFRNAPSPNYTGMTAYFPDFALLVRANRDTLLFTDSTTAVLTVPAVKLYTHGVRFTATVSPAAPFDLTFPGGDSLATVPDSLVLKIKTNNVAAGLYTITVVGRGPNGTPAHMRTIPIRVQGTTNSVVVLEPNGGEVWTAGALQQVRWAKSGAVSSVRVEYSTDNGTTWTLIDSSAADTSISWSVPTTPTTQALMRVAWVDSLTSVVDQSDSVFTISPPGVSTSFVVPPSYAGVPGTATFLGPLATSERTYQLLIHDSLLTGMAGRKIVALSWRIPPSATAAWPAADVTFTNYDIYFSGSVTPANRSLTNFSDNVVGPQTQVRATGLTIPANSYPSGGSPNDWGPEISFTPWLYTGGHLLVEIRHAGFSGTSRSTDAIGTSISGYGTLFSACWAGSYTGTSGSQGNFSVLRLTTQDTLTVSVGDAGTHIPSTAILEQNYPNPFNPSTTIRFGIPAGSSGEITTLKIFDVLGREVATLVSETLSPGTYTARFSQEGLSSGVYFYRLSTGKFTETKKMIFAK